MARHSDTPCEATGYHSEIYVNALVEFGKPRYLAHANGWIIERQIPDSDLLDGLGCYPLFCCKDWGRLEDDIDSLRADLVSLSLVTDPFGSFTPAQLEQNFDLVMRFKNHYVVDVSLELSKFINRSHRESVRRALKKVTVRVCQEPAKHLDDWVRLFSNLVDRHNIVGLRAFSRISFAYQLETPGLVMFEALVGGETVGLDLWYVQGEVAYGHLVAFNEVGYQTRASYATKWAILNYFKDKVRWVDLGGTPGAANNHQSGLDHFKAGFATDVRPVYFCGSIFKPDEYQELMRIRQIGATDYFPAYRAGEFI